MHMSSHVWMDVENRRNVDRWGARGGLLSDVTEREANAAEAFFKHHFVKLTKNFGSHVGAMSQKQT